MMTDSITRLYPLPPQELPPEGAYLGHDLRNLGTGHSEAYVVANFVSSIDGRIAVQRGKNGDLGVPPNVANPRDWRLFQELAAQADILLSSGRYLREWAQGKAQEILQVDDSRFADLREWRQNQGLPPHPDIAVISGSLDFPIPDVLTREGRRLVVATMEGQDTDRISEIERAGGIVLLAGQDNVDGRLLVEGLAALGYRVIYSAAGPRIHHLLLEAGMLDRLYLTLANRMLAGEPYSSILEGELLSPAADLSLNTVYYDPLGVDGRGQLFLSYDLPGKKGAKQ
jgi:riboflavin biosynthesis pyrimidine reductase